MATASVVTYDRDGNVVDTRTVQIPPEQTNAESVATKIEAQIQRAENADTNWANLTAAQKDSVLRQTMLTTAKLARHLLNRFEAD
jgi:acyl-CoA reductase-like NAD-dependent aldehyde dehydrogenase